MAKSDYIVIFVTSDSYEEALKIGKTLVEDELVACANIIPQIRSIFHWKGEVCDESEILLIMKSRAVLFEKIVDRVITLHSYDVPEIISLSILSGSKDYLNWIAEVTKSEF
ncbi:MAG: divalent-cation tolerance protein CutA [Thermodesulfobacteriota bacterium]|nr:divalent-cation tolerance protein CutA [Thermodesulfobacteriota bacterium]